MGRTASAILVLVLGVAVSTAAAEYEPVPRQIAPSTVPRIASPAGPVYSLGMPSPQRPPIDAPQGQFGHHGAFGPQGPAAPGWSGYGFGGVPTYQWGSFGARYRPTKVYHRGYYGHQMSYGYRRGY